MFRFDKEEFDAHILYRLVELDNGGVLMAENESFQSVFERTQIDGSDDVVSFRTQGRVVDERLRQTR